MEKKRTVPPSRKRYEAKYPLVTIRVAKEVKDRFQFIRSKQGISARRLFEKTLNSYIQINTQSKQANKLASNAREALYQVIVEPFHFYSINDPPEGWEGPLPKKGDITVDRNKIGTLEKLGFRFKEVKPF